MRRALAAAIAVLALWLAAPAWAAEAKKAPAHGWSFEGPFGRFDKAAMQRGFQVYKEVCASCHGVRLLTFRSLGGIGLGEADVKAIAAEYEIEDGPNEDGEMFTRPGRPADKIPPPFANDQAARVVNNGALPPDLSLITKARKGGADYLYAILIGYEDEPPEGVELGEGLSYNHYFKGFQIAMPPPLSEDAVEYIDGTDATVEQMAEDLTQFLMWAAEPKLEARKRLGIKTILFLILLSALFYASKRKIWAKVH
jgi:ubiquinol-cytochrome c reductase cytochrome c1 subunit